MTQIQDNSSVLIETPTVRKVSAGRPFVWLREGLSDLSRVASTSFGYGLVFAGLGAVLLTVAWGRGHLAPALITGFLLVAPFFAIVIYALSRGLERGETSTVEALHAWRRNASSISLYGFLLAFTLIAWERISAILFALFYGGNVPNLRNFLADVLFSGRYTELVMAYFGIGGLIAIAVFAFSVVAPQLMLDRDIDIATAIVTSIKCCTTNPLAMLVWAAIIAILMALGFVTWMIGLILVFPWLGHASWRAYRDLVE